jgi:hypothetical protein
MSNALQNVAGLFGGAAQDTAPFPKTGYPASAFFGATSLQPKVGGKSATDGGGMAPMSPEMLKKMAVIAGVIIIVGYVLFHLNYVKA